MEVIEDFWDLTFEDDEDTSAYNVGYKLGKCGPNIYVMEEIREHLDILGQIKEIPKLKAMHPETGTSTIERKANGHAAVQILKRKISGIRSVSPRESKEDRARSVIWFMEAENLIFPAQTVRTWADDAVDEIVSFGSKAMYKDRVDALVHGLQRLTTGVHADAGAVPESIEKLSDWAMEDTHGSYGSTSL